MAAFIAYHRPQTLAEALRLLSRPGTVVVAGGTSVRDLDTGVAVKLVDLQDLDLRSIVLRGDRVVIGATTTLEELADSPSVPDALREAARREMPSTLRPLATVGGCVASADGESELLAVLLAHDGRVELASPAGAEARRLVDVLGDRACLTGRIITAIDLEWEGKSAVCRTGRTEADRPIVAAVAHRAGDGTTRVALTGVAATPVLAGPAADLSPPADFRGSSEYRRELARVLRARALAALG